MLPDVLTEKKGKALVYTILCIGTFAIAIIGLIALLLWLLVSGEIVTVYDWIDGLGFWAYIIFGFLFAIVNLPVMVGYGLLLLLSGLLFGFWWGMLTAIVGSFFGWMPSFIIIRKAFFEKAKDYVDTKGGYFARAVMLELKNHQIKVALALRVAPGPPGLQTTILAVSPITTITFILTSFTGMLVRQVPFVFIGHGLTAVYQIIQAGGTASTNESNVSLILGAVGSILIIGIAVFISRQAKKTANKLKEEDEANEKLLGENVDENNKEDDYFANNIQEV